MLIAPQIGMLGFKTTERRCAILPFSRCHVIPPLGEGQAVRGVWAPRTVDFIIGRLDSEMAAGETKFGLCPHNFDWTALALYGFPLPAVWPRGVPSGCCRRCNKKIARLAELFFWVFNFSAVAYPGVYMPVYKHAGSGSCLDYSVADHQAVDQMRRQQLMRSRLRQAETDVQRKCSDGPV